MTRVHWCRIFRGLHDQDVEAYDSSSVHREPAEYRQPPEH